MLSFPNAIWRFIFKFDQFDLILQSAVQLQKTCSHGGLSPEKDSSGKQRVDTRNSSAGFAWYKNIIAEK